VQSVGHFSSKIANFIFIKNAKFGDFVYFFVQSECRSSLVMISVRSEDEAAVRSLSALLALWLCTDTYRAVFVGQIHNKWVFVCVEVAWGAGKPGSSGWHSWGTVGVTETWSSWVFCDAWEEAWTVHVGWILSHSTVGTLQWENLMILMLDYNGAVIDGGYLPHRFCHINTNFVIPT